jgi:hypothetical protein
MLSIVISVASAILLNETIESFRGSILFPVEGISKISSPKSKVKIKLIILKLLSVCFNSNPFFRTSGLIRKQIFLLPSIIQSL